MLERELKSKGFKSMGLFLNNESKVNDLAKSNQKNIYMLTIILVAMMGATKIASEIDPIYLPMGLTGGLIFGLILISHLFEWTDSFSLILSRLNVIHPGVEKKPWYVGWIEKPIELD